MEELGDFLRVWLKDGSYFDLEADMFAIAHAATTNAVAGRAEIVVLEGVSGAMNYVVNTEIAAYTLSTPENRNAARDNDRLHTEEQRAWKRMNPDWEDDDE